MLVALDPNTIQQSANYGTITAVFKYCTPYLINKQDSLLINFPLGNYISLCCVLDLSTLLALGEGINLVKKNSFSEIYYCFNITLDPPGKGLPEGIVFVITIPIFPLGVCSNITPTPSSLHYTSIEDHTISSPQPSYSDDIIAEDKYF